MTTYAAYRGVVQDYQGNVIPGASVEVKRETFGQPMATIYSDREGLYQITNPLTADALGRFDFFAAGGAYQVRAYSGGFEHILSYVAIGRAAEFDDVPAGYAATSTTSLLIGSGTKVFTVERDLAYVAGVRVRAISATDITSFMEGTVTSYLDDQLTVAVDIANGSATLAQWNITLAGQPGFNGTNGASSLTVVDLLATTNINLATFANGQTADGVVAQTGNIIVLTGQTDSTQNGVYTVPSVAPMTRNANFLTFDSMPGVFFSVLQGTDNEDSLWRCTSSKGGTLGAYPITFAEFGSSANSRIKLSTTQHFYISPTGSDTTGTGTELNPWRSVQKPYDEIMANYDLANQQAIIHMAPGTYNGGLLAFGRAVGQQSFNSIYYSGQHDTPENVIVNQGAPPPLAYYCFAGAFGAQFAFDGLTLDGTVGAQDMIQAGSQAVVGVGRVIIGNNINPWTDIISYDGGVIYITDNYTINKTFVGFNGDLTSGSPTIANVSNFAGIQLYQGVFAPGSVPLDTWITDFAPSLGTITMSKNALVTNTGVSLAALNGGVAHITSGRNGIIDYTTNGEARVDRNVNILGLPAYFQGFQYCNGGRHDVQAVRWINPGSVFAVPVTARANGICDNYREGVGGDYPPGNFVYFDGATFSVGDESFTISVAAGVQRGQFINGYVSIAAVLTAYSSDIQVASTTHMEGGCKVTGIGVPPGSDIIGIGSTSITIQNQPTVSGPTTIKVTGAGVKNGTYIRKIVGTTCHISQPTISSQTGIALACAGLQESGGQLV